MRWYALMGPDKPGGSPFIVAEAVAEMAGDGTFTLRESPVLCDSHRLVSLEELMWTEEGRLILQAWESGADSAYEQATRRLVARSLAHDARLFPAGEDTA